MDEKFGENGLPENAEQQVGQNMGVSDAQNVASDNAVDNSSVPTVEEQQNTEGLQSSNPQSVNNGGNPFVQSDSDFRKAENEYYNQIKNLESANISDEDRIRIEQVQADELKKEQEIAEREAKLRLQREELERREQELKEKQDAEREQREKEEREKRMAQEAEERKKREQEERIKRLEEEEQYQKQKLAELEAAEQQDQGRELHEIIPPDPDQAVIQKEKEKQLKEKLLQDKKSRKKMPFALKMLIIVGVLAVVIGVGLVVLKNMLAKPVDPNEIISANLMIAQDTFYEGDEIGELSKYYIEFTHQDGHTTTQPVDYQMITSDFVMENHGKLYIKVQDDLTTEMTANFSVKYNDYELSKPITIKGIENLTEIQFNVYTDNASFYEYDDVDVVDKLMVYSGRKILTPYQYKLYIECNDSTYQELEINDDFIITMPGRDTIGDGEHKFKMCAATNVNVGSAERIATIENLVINASNVLHIVCDNNTVELLSLDFCEEIDGRAGYEDNTIKDFTGALRDLANVGVYAELNNPSRKRIPVYPVYEDSPGVFKAIIFDSNGVRLDTLPDGYDARGYYLLQPIGSLDASKAFSVADGKLKYSSPKLGTNLSVSSTFHIISLSNSANKEITVYTKIDRVVSAELLSEVSYYGTAEENEIHVDDIIVINSTTINSVALNVRYTMQSGNVIEYNSMTNEVTHINSDERIINLGDIEFTRLQLKITTEDLTGAGVKNYRFNSSAFLFGGSNREEGIGAHVNIYLTCECATRANMALVYITTLNTLQN